MAALTLWPALTFIGSHEDFSQHFGDEEYWTVASDNIHPFGQSDAKIDAMRVPWACNAELDDDTPMELQYDQPAAIDYRAAMRTALDARKGSAFVAAETPSTFAVSTRGIVPKQQYGSIDCQHGSDQMIMREQSGVGSADGMSVSPVDLMILTPSSQQTSVSFRDETRDGYWTADVDPVLYPNDSSPTSTNLTLDSSFESLSRHQVRHGSLAFRMSDQRRAPPQPYSTSRDALGAGWIPSTAAPTTDPQWSSTIPSSQPWPSTYGGQQVHVDHFGNALSGYDAMSAHMDPSAYELSMTPVSFANPSMLNVPTNFENPLAFRGVEDHPWHPYYTDAQQQAQYMQQPYQQLQQVQPRNMPAYQQPSVQYIAPRPQPLSQNASASARVLAQSSIRSGSRAQTTTRVRQAPAVIHEADVSTLVKPASGQASQRRPKNQTILSQGMARSKRDIATAPRPQKRQLMDQSSPASSHSALSSPSRNLIKDESISPANSPPDEMPSIGKRGGRAKGSSLSTEKKRKTAVMRKIRACWCCKMQRDRCDDGPICHRCMIRAQKGDHYYFACNRSKLPDFVLDFLPPAMTLMHTRQTIEDTVKEQVGGWDERRSVDIYFTHGYGVPLRWKCNEFNPKSPELLGQLQYYQNAVTGISQGYQKYSPPFGLMRIDASDEAHFQSYLDRLMEDDCLPDLGWTCFEEDTQADPGMFQARLLTLMCDLYMQTEDEKLRHLLHNIIRMIIITYIMGHTLTILEDTLEAVVRDLRFTTAPDRILKHTSPRLANRQLKFFFSILRNNIYSEILRTQHNTFQTGGKKEVTWLSSFCAMLGFAMVLEEVQRTLQIQADAKVAKKECSPEEAYAQANNACERIDERFTLLIGLFQCKYRDKTWGDGTFGSGTPSLRTGPEVRFLKDVRDLLDQNRTHLNTRKDIDCSPENQCRFTSRLVARFLLPFLGLPP